MRSLHLHSRAVNAKSARMKIVSYCLITESLESYESVFLATQALTKRVMSYIEEYGMEPQGAPCCANGVLIQAMVQLDGAGRVPGGAAFSKNCSMRLVRSS